MLYRKTRFLLKDKNLKVWKISDYRNFLLRRVCVKACFGGDYFAGQSFCKRRRVTDPAIRVTVRDRVTVDGKTVRPSARKVYIMLNKPVSVLSSSSDDRGRRCVVELVDIPGVRLFAVGRLDYDIIRSYFAYKRR